MVVKPIETRRLYLQIADKLRALMEEQGFAPNGRLPSERELALMLGVSRPSVREALVALGAATSEEILRALAAQHGLPFRSREELPLMPPIVKLLSPKYLRQYVACPIAVDGATVTVATAEPANPMLGDDLRKTLGSAVQLCVAPAEAILETIERAYGANTALQKIVEGMGTARTAFDLGAFMLALCFPAYWAFDRLSARALAAN